MKNIVLLGAPGAGKGTQAALISKEYNIPHISTGAILRKHIQEGTELGLEAKTFIDKGNLVPDSLVINIVADRLSQDDAKNGYILDGFPRTIAQAEALDKVATIDLVLDINVPFEAIIERLSGRLACKCGETSHVDWVDSDRKCPKCGETLFVRDDDKPETVRARLDVYEKQTAPLIGYYQSKGNLVSVDVEHSDQVEDVFEKVKKVL
jgi:adenylate kinase